MNARAILVLCVIVVLLVCAGCTRSPGVPRSDSVVLPPNEVLEFNVLYTENCAGCHGKDGKGGVAIALSNSVFLAIAADGVIRDTAANGVPGSPMPAFAQDAGGMLTGQQIDALARGIRSWADPDALRDTTLPPYKAREPGDPQRGAHVYQTYCSSCHGVDGRGGNKASSVVDGSYLALVSDQQLRTIVIAGRPELGAPDWRGNVNGQPMSAQEISDVVAWLSSQRQQLPGQPYAISSSARAKEQHR